jgi:hypothetical protein
VSFRHAATVCRQFAPGGADRSGSSPEVERARQLCRHLEIVGVVPQVIHSGRQAIVPGAALVVDSSIGLGAGVAAAQLHEHAFSILATGTRLSVAIAGLDTTAAPADAVHGVLRTLKAAAGDAAVSPDTIEIAIDASALTPASVWAIRQEVLGSGPVYLIADGAKMNPEEGWSARERCDQFWLQLWQLRDVQSIRSAYASVVSSPCPLLSAESATTVPPGCEVQVPEGSAWLPLHLDLTHFASASGCVDEPALEKALHCSVDLGDALIDLIEWPTAMTRHDAWLNRRLAITVSGLGDLARRRRLDPTLHRSVDTLRELLQWVRQTLQARSGQLARLTGHVPALDLQDPGPLFAGAESHDDWRARWNHALEKGAVRNRNLTVLSPWSVFPTNAPPDMQFADLLPVIAAADACAFNRSTSLEAWNLNEFKSFHQRAWAALQHRDRNVLAAEQL